MNEKSTLFCGTPPFETVTDLYCITMLFLFPLFPGFSGYSNITFSKFVFLLIATGIWLLALAVCAFLRKEPLPRPGAAQWSALIFLAVALCSACCSPFFPQTLLGAGRYDGLLSIALYVLIFLGVSMFTRPKLIHFYAFAAAVTLCCIVAILQLFGGNPLGLYPNALQWQDAGIRYSGAYLGTIGNTNLLDAVLCLALPLSSCAILRMRRWLFLIPLIVSAVIIAVAGGSGAVVALGAFCLAALCALPRQKKLLIFCLLLAAFLLLGVLALLWFWPGTDGAAYEISQMIHGHFEDSYGSSRILIWRGCLALAPERPLLGGGPGTLSMRLDIIFSRFVPETGTTLESYVDNAHNIYLGYLTNTGVLGLAAYLWLLLCCGLSAFSSNDLSRVCALAVFCGAVHAFFGLGLCLTEPIFFVFLGFCASRIGKKTYQEAS